MLKVDPSKRERNRIYISEYNCANAAAKFHPDWTLGAFFLRGDLMGGARVGGTWVVHVCMVTNPMKDCFHFTGFLLVVDKIIKEGSNIKNISKKK